MAKKTKRRRILAHGEDQLGAISDVEEMGAEPRIMRIQPDAAIVDESRANDRARADFDEPPDMPDEEYWVETISQIAIAHNS